ATYGNQPATHDVLLLMTRYPRLAGVGTVLGLVAILSACVGAGAPSHASTPATAGSTASGRPAQSVPPLATVPPSGEAVTGEVPAGILDRIVADAAVRAGTDPAEITVIRGESVTWPDGSLGCPEPGMMYTQ